MLEIRSTACDHITRQSCQNYESKDYRQLNQRTHKQENQKPFHKKLWKHKILMRISRIRLQPPAFRFISYEDNRSEHASKQNANTFK